MSDEIITSSSLPQAAVPASSLDNDDLLEEILIHLPPQRSSLPRVSAVCKRWRGLVADPRFLRRRLKPAPLLGALVCSDKETVFAPILEPVEGTPLDRFDLGDCSKRYHYRVLDCHHGRVLVKHLWRKELVVCEPITGEQHRVPIPAEFKWTRGHLNGVVLCADAAHHHVHGGCQSSPYKVALMSMYETTDNRVIACVYSSETGILGNYVSTSASRATFYAHNHGTLTGSALYWLPMKDHILEFDLDRHTLAMIEGPQCLNEPHKHRVIKAEDGDVGLFVLSENSIQMWQMKVNYQGVTTWLLRNNAILEISPRVKIKKIRLLGYDEDTESIILRMHGGVYTVHLKSMECKKLDQVTNYANCRYYPFKSFRPPGIEISAGCVRAKALHGALG